MNPLTQIKNTQKASQREIAQGVGDSASWHAKFKHSAYVFAGGLSYDLTEGDLLAVFAQYGEIVDVNLVKDKDTGKTRGFAFLAYEDQRSTVLAVDNLSGAKVAGRIITVNHVDNYKIKRAEMEGREVSPDSEPEDGEDEDERPAGATNGARAAASAAPAAGGDAPWGNNNSVFALLSSAADPMPPPPPRAVGMAVVANGADGHKKDKRHKKEKWEKKEKKAKHGKKARVDRPGPASSDSDDGRQTARRSPPHSEPGHHRSAQPPSAHAAEDRPSGRAAAGREQGREQNSTRHHTDGGQQRTALQSRDDASGHRRSHGKDFHRDRDDLRGRDDAGGDSRRREDFERSRRRRSRSRSPSRR